MSVEAHVTAPDHLTVAEMRDVAARARTQLLASIDDLTEARISIDVSPPPRAAAAPAGERELSATSI